METNYAIEYRDLAALATIGDMMNLKDFETQFIVKDGIQRIRNPFFVEMMNRQKFQFEGGITPIGIAFYVVPYMNAMTRSGTMEEKAVLFESMLEWKSNLMVPSTKRGCKGQIETLHEQAGRVCVNVKGRQKKNQDSSLEAIEKLIEEENLLDNKILIIRVPEYQVDKNLAGLIANQLASKYARPTLVLRIIEEELGVTPDGANIIMHTYYAGSGRNYGKSRLENFREFCLDTGLVEYA
jgi:single-stranded-DNA-specific exonuclease